MKRNDPRMEIGRYVEAGLIGPQRGPFQLQGALQASGDAVVVGVHAEPRQGSWWFHVPRRVGDNAGWNLWFVIRKAPKRGYLVAAQFEEFAELRRLALLVLKRVKSRYGSGVILLANGRRVGPGRPPVTAAKLLDDMRKVEKVDILCESGRDTPLAEALKQYKLTRSTYYRTKRILSSQ